MPALPNIGAFLSSKLSKIPIGRIGEFFKRIPVNHPYFKVVKRIAFVAAAYSEFKNAPKVWDWWTNLRKQEEVIAGDQEFNKLKIDNDIEQYKNTIKQTAVQYLRVNDPNSEIMNSISKDMQSGNSVHYPNGSIKGKVFNAFKTASGYLPLVEMCGPRDVQQNNLSARWLKSSVQMPRDSLDYWGSYKNLFEKSPNLQFNVSEPEIIALDDETYRKISEINLDVNKSIHYIGDEVKAGKEDEMTVVENQLGLGDCDDYAVTKIDRLMKAGYPRSALRLGFVTVGEEGHMVTIVTTDRGDFVLDNNSDEVLPWYKAGQQYGYKYIALESPTSSDKHEVLIPQ